MNTSIEELIAERPHLAGPLRFYQKTMQFADAVRELGWLPSPDQTAYPMRLIGRIIERFQQTFDFPTGSLLPLVQAMELGEVDFTRLPLLEVPAFSFPYAEEDLLLLLFVLSRPYFFGMHEVSSHGSDFWEKGVCPVCGARPSLSIVSRTGRRRFLCSFCGAGGLGAASGCPACCSQDLVQKMVIEFGQEEVTVLGCDSCKAYIKIADEKLFTRLKPDLVDLVSLQHDIVTQNQGYKRLAPNPIGMLRMSVSG